MQRRKNYITANRLLRCRRLLSCGAGSVFGVGATRRAQPIQQTIAAVFKANLNHPQLERKQARQVIKLLGHPMRGVAIKQLKQVYEAYTGHKDVSKLLAAVEEIQTVKQANEPRKLSEIHQLSRDDLHLICWEYVWS